MSDFTFEDIDTLIKNPRLSGVLDSPTLVVKGLNSRCGDRVTFYLQLEGDKIVDVRFQATGCALSRAAACVLAEEIQSKTISELGEINTECHLTMFGTLQPLRSNCVLLPCISLKKVAEIRNKNELRVIEITI